jgi:hypothetical protein
MSGNANKQGTSSIKEKFEENFWSEIAVRAELLELIFVSGPGFLHFLPTLFAGPIVADHRLNFRFPPHLSFPTFLFLPPSSNRANFALSGSLSRAFQL